MSVIRFPAQCWRRYRLLMLAFGPASQALLHALLALFLAAVFQGIALACMYPIAADIMRNAAPAALACPVALMTLSALLATVLRWYGQGFEYNGHLVAATYALRLKLGEKLRRISLEALQHTRAGEMSAVLLGSIDEHFNYVIAIANTACTSIITPLTVAAFALSVNWRLSIAILLIFPLIAGLHRWQRPMMREHIQRLAQANQALGGDIVEFIQGVETLRACGKEEVRYAAIRARCHRFKQLQQTLHRRSAKTTLFTSSAVELAMLGILCVGVLWVVSGTLTLAALIITMVIISRFSEPMATFINHTVVVELLSNTLQHLQQLLEMPTLPVLAGSAVPRTFDVTFDHVTFCYAQQSHNTVQALSVCFKCGRISALVGASGAGKSTLARLLQRYADPQCGAVKIGEVDIRTLPQNQLNSYISLVFQEVFLFNDTLLANLWMARPDASREEVQQAAQKAQCLDFIERLPQGWHTRIEEAGITLSGGERQRLSIARAFLKNTPIVVLDEPTASLDGESEQAIQSALKHLAHGRTILLITHRHTTLLSADKIYFMANGQIVDQGTHTGLMAANAAYRALWAQEAQQ